MGADKRESGAEGGKKEVNPHEGRHSGCKCPVVAYCHLVHAVYARECLRPRVHVRLCKILPLKPQRSGTAMELARLVGGRKKKLQSER